MKKILVVIFTLSMLLSVWIHPAKGSNPTINAIAGCLPQKDGRIFKLIDSVDIKDLSVWRYYLVLVADEGKPQWGTVAELHKDGTCKNPYPAEHVDIEFSKLPPAIAQRFKAATIKARQSEWEKQEQEQRELSEKLGIPINRLGGD